MIVISRRLTNARREVCLLSHNSCQNIHKILYKTEIIQVVDFITQKKILRGKRVKWKYTFEMREIPLTVKLDDFPVEVILELNVGKSVYIQFK